MISDERRAANNARQRIRNEIALAADETMNRVHEELHIEKWNRDYGLPASRPPLVEMCSGEPTCVQLRQAVNKVKHALSRLA